MRSEEEKKQVEITTLPSNPANFTFLVLWDMAVTSTGWKRLWEQKNKVKGKGGFVNRSLEVLWRSFPSFYVWGEVWEGNGVNSAIKGL